MLNRCVLGRDRSQCKIPGVQSKLICQVQGQCASSRVSKGKNRREKDQRTKRGVCVCVSCSWTGGVAGVGVVVELGPGLGQTGRV